WGQELAQGAAATAVAAGFLASPEATDIEVQALYWQYLGRRAALAGRMGWAGQLQGGAAGEQGLAGARGAPAPLPAPHSRRRPPDPREAPEAPGPPAPSAPWGVGPGPAGTHSAGALPGALAHHRLHQADEARPVRPVGAARQGPTSLKGTAPLRPTARSVSL